MKSPDQQQNLNREVFPIENLNKKPSVIPPQYKDMPS